MVGRKNDQGEGPLLLHVKNVNPTTIHKNSAMFLERLLASTGSTGGCFSENIKSGEESRTPPAGLPSRTLLVLVVH